MDQKPKKSKENTDLRNESDRDLDILKEQENMEIRKEYMLKQLDARLEAYYMRVLPGAMEKLNGGAKKPSSKEDDKI